MRPDCLLAAATLLLLAVPTSALPLFQVLNSTRNVSLFANLLHDTGMYEQMNLGGSCSAIRCFLVFAPSNTAIDNAYKANPSGFSSMSDKTALAQQHYLTSTKTGTKGTLSAWSSIDTPTGLDIGFGKVQILETTHTTLYWLAKQTGSVWSYRINNAAIVVAESDREGDAGVFHVLDQVALPIGSKQSFSDLIANPTASIANQLGVRKSLAMFGEWMTRDSTYQYLYNALKSTSAYRVRTVFLPSDAAWDRIPSAVMQTLNSSVAEYRKVLLAHFAPDICVFTSWMSLGSSIGFSTGHSDVALYTDTKMYLNSAQKAFISAGGVVAQFVDKSINYAIGDTIIHTVDRVLAFAYEDLASLAQANTPDFYRICSGVPSCLSLLRGNSTQLTLFAPADVTSLSSIGNGTQLEQLLMLHFVPGVVGKPSMKESDLLATMSGVGQMRFRMPTETKCFVEGRLSGRGFVRAELLMYDQPAKNGIFHKVARALGQPVQTIQEFINSHEDLTSVSQYMGSTGFDPNLGLASFPYTVFPPNNAAMTAFSNYKSVSGAMVGSVIMQNAKLRDRVFRRMVLPNQRIIADTAPVGFTEYPTANTAESEKVTVNLKGSAGLSTRTMEVTGSFVLANISLAAGEYECVNGMVYPTGTVLFRDTDVEGYTRSGTATGANSLALAAGLVVLLAARIASRHD